MTREEAINILDRRTTIPGEGFTWEQINEAIDMAISALAPINQEQVEEMWRGEWVCVPKMGVYDMECSKCGYSPGVRFFSSEFCHACGAPMTDKAVEMMMERLERLTEQQEGGQ